MQTTPTIKIFVWLMFALSIVAIVISALAVAYVRLPVEISPAQGKIMLFSSSIAAVVTLLLGTMHYHIGKTHLRLNVAFFDVLGGRIRLDNVLNIVKKDGKLYLSYIWQGGDPVIAQIAVSPKRFEAVKDALIEKNSQIIYFDQDKEEQ